MRILIAFATRHGATAEIAEAIAEELTLLGHRAEVKEVAGIGDLATYDAVLLGSAVYFGQWRKEALAFARAHAAELRARPLWLFDSGPLNRTSEEGVNEPVAAADELVRDLGARGRTTFGGRLREKDSGFFVRQLMRSDRAGSFGDFRNFDRIRAWARKVGTELRFLEPVPAA